MTVKYDPLVLLGELVIEEGIKLRVYDDATGIPIGPGSHVIGHPTIGIGRALDVRGLTVDEARQLCFTDIASIVDDLSGLPWFAGLDAVRQRAVSQMRFQLGMGGLLAFHDMITALSRQQWQAAADACLASHWRDQAPARCLRIASMLVTGEAPTYYAGAARATATT